MSRLMRSLLICASVMCTGHVVAGQDAALFGPVGQVGASESGDVLRLAGGSGWLQTRRIYSDFVLECEFRLVDAKAKASIGFRAWPGYGDGSTNYEGYRLHLTAASVGEQAIGRVSSVGVKFNELAFDAASAALLAGTAGQWHRVRLRVEGSSAVIAIDDRVVSDVEGLSEFTGYLTLAGRDGAAEFKALRVEKLTGLGKPFGEGASGITDPGLERPRALVTSKPRYPKEPFDRGIQGAVLLEVVILADGAVGDIRVTRPLDSELDDAAIASARQWRFSPAVKAGQPMPVIVSMEVSFTIADRR